MSSWRDAQRRRRRLTLRGRLTLVGALALLAGVAGALSAVLQAPPAADPPAAASAPTASPAASAPAAGPAADGAGGEPAVAAGTETAAGALPAVASPPPGAPGPPPAAAPAVAAGPPAPHSTLDPELTHRVERVLERGRVELGHVFVMDPHSGKVRVAVSTDPERFPPDRTYPAASLIKVVTAAAALDVDPAVADRTCRYVGSPWRLTRRRVDPPRRGNESSFRKALAISNNQCFAQLAVHTVGADVLLDAIGRFGLLDAPAPGFPAGRVEPAADPYALGKLGSGLAGTHITPLHAVQLAAVLADGVLREPLWIEEAVPDRPPRRVLTRELAGRLRGMLVDTTARGTARSAFRDPRGRPLLGSIRVAGKTGSLSGRNPTGRYEWFAGVAPADAPEVAIAVVLVQGDLWWRNASQIAAAVLKERFCPDRTCR